MKKTIISILFLLSGLSVYAVDSQTPSFEIKGVLAKSLLQAMLDKHFSGADSTSGGTISVADASVYCSYRNKDHELHSGTGADYKCIITDNAVSGVGISITGKSARYLLKKMQTEKFGGGDSTLGGIDSMSGVAVACNMRTHDNEKYTGTSSDSNCEFVDKSR